MAKVKKDRARVRPRRRQQKKPKNPASSARTEQPEKLLGSLREQKLADFAPIAKLITPDPPEWLAEHLQRWSSSILLSHAVERRQPTRAQMLKILTSIDKAAALLMRAMGEPSVCEFLDAGGNGPMDSAAKFRLLLDEIKIRADRAAKLPKLAGPDGKAKAGKSRALPDGAILAQTYCSVLIAESWKWFRGKYPPPRNRQAAEAIDLYWKLAGGAKQSWGSDTLNSWRYHLDKISKIPAEKERAEYRRHLHEFEHAAAMLRSDPS